VLTDHSERALAVQAGAFGSFNDKTVVRYSDDVHTARTDPIYTDFQYEVRAGSSEDGRCMERGAFGIIDGGVSQVGGQASSR